jgi:hypothetical protein
VVFKQSPRIEHKESLEAAFFINQSNYFEGQIDVNNDKYAKQSIGERLEKGKL